MAFGSTRPRALQRTGVILATLCLMAGATLLGPRAALAFTPVPESTPGYLTLHSAPATLVFSDLSPGTVGYGAVRVSLDDADRADLSLRAYGDGALFEMAGGLTLVASMCDDAWQDIPEDGRLTAAALAGGTAHEPVCPTGGREVASIGADTGSPTDSLDSGIGSITKGEPRYILVELRMPGTTSGNDERLMGQSADFSMQITASGDSPPDDLEIGGEPDTDGEPGPGGGEPGSPGITPVQPGAPLPAEPLPGVLSPAATPQDAMLPATGVEILGAVLCAAGVIGLGVLTRLRRPRGRTDHP